MKGYENNMADQDLIVRSIKVLKNMDSGETREIKQMIGSLKNQIFVQSKLQEHYWDDLSDDGIISPLEKQSLRREVENIRRSYAAVTAEAAEYGYTGNLIQLLTQSHDALFSYIYEGLSLFDNMSENTPLPDRTLFNSLFSTYYYYESFVLMAISTGIIDQINLRALSSLSEDGTQDELGIYRGGIYQYTDGEWKNVTTGAYKGPREELPGDEEGAFFICREDFTAAGELRISYVDVPALGLNTDSEHPETITELGINGELLGIRTANDNPSTVDDMLYTNGDQLILSVAYRKGLIYYFENQSWKPVENLGDWRYSAAFSDVITITGRLPQIFQDAIDAVNARVDAVAASLTQASATLSDEIATRQGQYTIIAGDIVRIDSDIDDIIDLANSRYAELNGALAQKISHLPVYFGGSNTDPQNAQEGDFFTYTGATYGNREHTKVYLFHNGAWVGLAPTESSNRSYYMMALEDILAGNDASNGYFAAIFAQSLFTHDATLETLSTKRVYLRNGGVIQSDNSQYVHGKLGLSIDANGNIDANGSTHIGGVCTIDGDTTIQGDCVIGGNVVFGGILSGCAGRLSGNLVCTGFEISGLEPGYNRIKDLSLSMSHNYAVRHWVICGSGRVKVYGYVSERVKIEVAGRTIVDYNSSETIYVDTDVDVYEGDVFKVEVGGSWGVSGASGSFQGGVYAKYPNALVTYLGKDIEEDIEHWHGR